MQVTEEQARQVVFSIHDAWNRRELERMLSFYVEDLTFYANIGGPNGEGLTIAGKENFRQSIQRWSRLECLTVPQLFKFESGIARASIEFYIRDPESGQSHASTYRQFASFRDARIFRMEEYHDAAALMAFMSLLKK